MTNRCKKEKPVIVHVAQLAPSAAPTHPKISFVRRALAHLGLVAAPIAEEKPRTFLDNYADDQFIRGYAKTCHLPAKEARQDWLALKQFAEMCKSEGGVFAPPLRVDRILHQLLAAEEPLRRFSHALRGQIEHSPPGHATREDIARTQYVSREKFGRELDPGIWAEHRYFGCIAGVRCLPA